LAKITQVLQTPTFKKAVKKLHKNQKADLDEAIKELHRILSGDVSESCEKRNDFLINHLNLCTEALTQESLYLSKNK
jgi:fatty acid-binding protein DegV